MAGLNPVSFFQGAISRGLGPTATREAFRGAGGRISNANAGRLYGEILNQRAIADTEFDRPLHRKPLADEIGTRTTVSAVGYRQSVTVYTRVRGTTDLKARHYSIRSDSLLTRQGAIDRVIDTYGSYAENYGEVVVGADYSSTEQFIPGDFE